jgi:hypothetical protein
MAILHQQQDHAGASGTDKLAHGKQAGFGA